MGVLIGRSSGVLHPCSAAFGREIGAGGAHLVVRTCLVLDRLLSKCFVQGRAVELSGVPKRSRQRLAAQRERETAGIGMQVRASSRQSTASVDDSATVDRDDPQELGLRHPGSAPHTGADRSEAKPLGRVYRFRPPRHPAGSAVGSAPVGPSSSASEWMSMRQPVRRAASRAF